MAPASSKSGQLRIGFLPLTDAAPLIAAVRHGFFERQGLSVVLSREVGWATIREKIIMGELDAAPAPAPMLWAMHLGMGCQACPVLTAFVLSLNGNAITLSRALAPELLEGKGLGAIARKRSSGQTLTFGVVFRYSSHLLLLRDWLRTQGLEPERDARVVVVPPGQMFRNLQAGTIDGYVSGEPWNTFAVQQGAGWCPSWTASSRVDQIEKVLLVTRAFSEAKPAEHRALIRALALACAWCDSPENREPIAALLSEQSYLHMPSAVILPSLIGRFDAGSGPQDVPQFHVFSAGNANAPTPEKGMELQTRMVREGLVPRGTALAKSLFRNDLYEEAGIHEAQQSTP
jgi:ABC-type nitrate/sulfonate/bicarbonate transport system substrate-binding protein